jgi:hypothetical protein
MAERRKVPSGYHGRLHAEALARDALLELEWEESVVAACDGVERDRRPGLKRADVVDLAESG